GALMLLVIALVLLVTFLVCRLAIKRAAKPLKLLAATADEVAGGQFGAKLPTIKSNDEICMLRDSFENMQHSLATYIDELRSTTAAKASMESELKIAHDIQMSMLPKTYPAFPDRHDIDIFGQVTPAKAVGGDLYDFLIRDEKLFFCIGDVSGKGVPASLVMAVTRSLFRNIAAYTAEPDHIVVALNDALSNNNDAGMFVTLFIGVLDLGTGHLSYSNAGHNAPLLVSNGEVSVLPCDPNIPVGVMNDWKYTVQHIQLTTGASIFLYTDGLNEAEDVYHRQFGMERVKQVAKVSLNQPQSLIDAMKTSVQLFVGNAEQSDDMTMLTVQYTK
ncbi:MAG: SpoIIE family protein phosphatase, partial [Bacteroidaceae bacterium]|nr:SpoIIE family protein phosphatase [Bacteroidaceae bacterium]